MPTVPPPGENEYFIEAENASEMARLMQQDRLTTEGMEGVPFGCASCQRGSLPE